MRGHLRPGNERPLGTPFARFAALVLLLAACSFGWVRSGAGSDGIVLVGYGTSGTPEQSSGAVDAAPDLAGLLSASSFRITGSVTGLYPGKHLPLTLRVTNPQTFAITVTSISTKVSGASLACPAANVKVPSFVGNLLVNAGKTAHVTVRATMALSAPNACQGARFPFQYSGLATEAGG